MTYKQLLSKFEDITILDNPICVYLTLTKVKRVTVLEETIKNELNESNTCETFLSETGGIREYFKSNKFNHDVLPMLISIVEEHRNQH